MVGGLRSILLVVVVGIVVVVEEVVENKKTGFVVEMNRKRVENEE